MTKSKILLGFLCLSILTFVVGCDGANGRVSITGKVTVNGEPVPFGTVQFAPAEGTNGPAAGAAIKDGAYTLDAKRGVFPGKYSVNIEAQKIVIGKYNDMSGKEVEGEMNESILPAKYARGNGKEPEVPLTAEVKKGKNVIDFELTD